MSRTVRRVFRLAWAEALVSVPKNKAARNKGSQEAKAAEAAAKNLVLLMQRASQLVGRISGDVERDPDNYALKPDTGDSLVEFVDELKLGILSSTGTKAVKRQFGSRFQPLLLLFADRCTSLAERMLKVATKIDNMAKATTEAAEVTEKAKKKRRSGGTEKDKPRDLGF
eukprot:s1812_g14.t1